MVYCTHCGTKNKDDANFCVKCGAKLNVSTEARLEKRIEEGAEQFGKRAEEWGKDFEKHVETECFGIPHVGTLFGLIIGLFIILVGVLSLIGIDFHFWPLAIIFFGLLVFSGAVYAIISKR